jgi:hypothetical protein
VLPVDLQGYRLDAEMADLATKSIDQLGLNAAFLGANSVGAARYDTDARRADLVRILNLGLPPSDPVNRIVARADELHAQGERLSLIVVGFMAVVLLLTIGRAGSEQRARAVLLPSWGLLTVLGTVAVLVWT